ncbi:MAG: ABC transporter permease [Bacillota bacterium]|nr:ABC transporter permease [Bacillota bacterium]
MTVFEILISANFLRVILRVTTPILFATLAGAVSSKSGIFNIALEGIMLLAALIGVIFSALLNSAWLGLLAAITFGGLVGLFLGFLVLKFKTNDILAGIAINLMAAGGTIFMLFLVSGDRGVSSSINSLVLPNVNIPLIQNIPFIGRVLSGHNVLTYLVFISVFVMHMFMYKTPLGLKIRAVGENPDAAESVGINVHKIQYIALGLSGVLSGFGGAFLSMGYLSYFTTNMTAGRGFIGLAANAMGRSTPIGGMLVALLFGTADAMANVFQTGIDIPYELIQMLPYITVIVGLSAFSYRNMKKKQRTIEK